MVDSQVGSVSFVFEDVYSGWNLLSSVKWSGKFVFARTLPLRQGCGATSRRFLVKRNMS